MPDAEIIHPSELGPAEIGRWTAMQLQTPAFAGPLLGPAFAQAVGEVRDDARVAIWREGGAPSGFLPHHRRPLGFARPIGAPFSDDHGLVSAPDFALTGQEVLRSAKLDAFRFHALQDPFELFAASRRATVEAYRIDLTGSSASYLEQLREGSGGRLKTYRRYRAKLERTFGPVRLVADVDRAAFARLLQWKEAQLRRTGLHDYVRLPWARELLERLFQTREGPLSGLMLNLYAGDRHVAGHFGVRAQARYHPWIGAMDPELDAYAPGSVHQWSAIAAMGELGLTVYDLGPGSDHWKRSFASDAAPLSAGLAISPGFGGRLARTSDGIWSLPPLERSGLGQRLRNRLDQIAAMELTLGGRVRGVLDAAAGFGRREATRRPPAASA